jgi:hypothetical protein
MAVPGRTSAAPGGPGEGAVTDTVTKEVPQRLVGLMLLLATVSFAQQVKFDYDRSANFGQYKTFSWGKVQTKDLLLGVKIRKGERLAHPPVDIQEKSCK